jgi:hypothetical protein
MSVTDEHVRAAIDDLLDQRVPPATICPSEVARSLAEHGWRQLMPQVRAVALDMAKKGALDVRQRGRTVAPDGMLRGPIRLGRPIAPAEVHATTPDGRYFVVNGRLWRRANPHLPADVRQKLVQELMDARRALRGSAPEAVRQAAREQVDRAKRALGERGPVWWTDGAPDFNRWMARNTPYGEWFARLGG